ncbi:hypothetical protein ILUMI_18480 [Ignelater luminosus]|uniref:Uncharacterized protein n=1 Tax=Ignelater luminosus TaxID=2038154 RepID=A0A8K0CHX4_IGNLU|nr:hypothetical protein ILUMI_18480 [Ignelater luminosus]
MLLENMLATIQSIIITTLFRICLIAIIIKIFAKLTAGWCKSNAYLGGKTALITGGSTGIGYETALGLAARGCRVIIAHKNEIPHLKEDIIKKTGNSNIVIKHFDMASLESVRELARDINENENRLDMLINNAGVGGWHNCYTKDGLHKSMQINHFGGFLLTHLLIGTCICRDFQIDFGFFHNFEFQLKNRKCKKETSLNNL